MNYYSKYDNDDEFDIDESFSSFWKLLDDKRSKEPPKPKKVLTYKRVGYVSASLLNKYPFVADRLKYHVVFECSKEFMDEILGSISSDAGAILLDYDGVFHVFFENDEDAKSLISSLSRIKLKLK